ncbi:MAG: DUF4968 domain-containing protein, partial [Prevotella sp.]
MKRLFTALLVVMAVLTIRAQEGNHYNITAANQTVCVTFYTPDIVRVTKAPAGYEYKEQKSEVITLSPSTSLPISVSSSASTVRLKSSSLLVTIDRRTGLLSFSSSNGKPLLKEKAISFEPRT